MEKALPYTHWRKFCNGFKSWCLWWGRTDLGLIEMRLPSKMCYQIMFLPECNRVFWNKSHHIKNQVQDFQSRGA